MNKTLRIVLGFVVSAVCLWLVFKNVSFQEIAANLKEANKSWFLLVLLTTILGHVMRTYRWRTLLSPVQTVPAFKLFLLLTFGFLMNNVLPARAGEVLRAYATDRETGVPTSTCLGSIALERLSDLFGLLFVGAAALTVLPSDRIPVAKITVIICGGLIGIVALFLFFQKRRASDQLPKPLQWVISFLQKVTVGFAAIKSPSKMVFVFGLSVVIWIIEILNVILAARAFSIELPFTHGAAVLAGIAVGVMIPAAPGYVGTFELFGQQSMILLGYSAALSLTFIFTYHVFQLILNSLLGLPGFFKMGLEPQR